MDIVRRKVDVGWNESCLMLSSRVEVGKLAGHCSMKSK